MKIYSRPIVVVSKCLGFAECRYNGVTIHNDFVERLGEFVDYILVCPEIEIGLGVPRSPIRAVFSNGEKRIYQPSTKRDITSEMNDFSDNFLDSLNDVDGFLLKHRSPSCAVYDAKIYQDFEGSVHFNGSGIFGERVASQFNVAIEDEGRLKNFIIRENFLIKIFIYASLREAVNLQELRAFHNKNNYLLRAYDERKSYEMEALLDSDKGDFNSLKKDYSNLFYLALQDYPSRVDWTRVINLMFHELSEDLSKKDLGFFEGKIDEYMNKRIPISVLLEIIKSYAVHFKKDKLLNQSIFEPYPLKLRDIKDSGNGRDDYKSKPAPDLHASI